MDDLTLGNDFDERELQELLGLFDAPAYVRRAKGVEEALEHLLLRGRARREEWLSMPRLRLGQLFALAGEWPAIRVFVRDDKQLGVLESLRVTLAPRLRAPLTPTSSRKILRGAMLDLVISLERFNRRWMEYLAQIDRTTINELREGYNQHYVVEKACALRSDVLARRGFTPLPLLTLEELQRHLPLLPVPKLAEGLHR